MFSLFQAARALVVMISKSTGFSISERQWLDFKSQPRVDRQTHTNTHKMNAQHFAQVESNPLLIHYSARALEGPKPNSLFVQHLLSSVHSIPTSLSQGSLASTVVERQHQAVFGEIAETKLALRG